MDTSQIEAVIYRNPRSLLLAIIAAFGVPWAVKNYRKFLALGKSGLTPLGPLGWIVALTLTAFGRETVSTAQYETSGATKERWLETPPERRGARPLTGWHCVPHRQTDRMPSDEMAKVRCVYPSFSKLTDWALTALGSRLRETRRREPVPRANHALAAREDRPGDDPPPGRPVAAPGRCAGAAGDRAHTPHRP